MKNLITIIICLTPLVAFSQPTDEQKGAAVGFLSKNTIIPPAPEAASLGQYGNVPISFYTGRINLSIPLYEIKGKEISLPISLSYNSGGVKVAEDPGWVGMGWTLNAGGVITRSVFGRPDEYQNYYYLVDSIVKDVTNFSKKGQQDYYLKLTKNLFETQPDAYFFNFGVLSGKFYIKPTQEIVQIEKQSIGFSFDNWYLDNPSFSAVGPDGTKYFFEDKEWTALLYDFDDGGVSIRHSYDFISSWYLTKIISRNKLDTISFNYTVTESLPVSVAPSSESISYNIHGATQTTDGGGGNGATGPCGEGATSTSYGPTTSIARIYLDNITYRDTKVVFTSIDNTSAFGGRQLTEVNVLIDNSQYRKFALEQDYAGSPSETNDERLRLEKIQVYGHSRLASPPYEFTYSSRNLPNKHDKGVDHWGYFNGGGNVSLIPSIPNGDCTFGRDANRKTNKVLVGAGSLKRVTYPTGGHTDFSFGANRRQNAYSGPTIGRVEHGYPVRADVFGGSISSGPCYGKPKYFIQSFTIPSEVTKVTVYPPGNEACEFFHGEGLKVFAGIIEAGRFNADCDMYAYALANLDKFKYHWFMEGDAHPRGSFSGLSPGKYYMILVSDQEIYPIPTVVPPLCAGLNPQQLGGNVTLSLNYYKMELDTIPNNPEDFVGGLRIEKVTDYSADGLVSSTREYEYFESQTFGDPNYMSNSTYSYEARNLTGIQRRLQFRQAVEQVWALF